MVCKVNCHVHFGVLENNTTLGEFLFCGLVGYKSAF